MTPRSLYSVVWMYRSAATYDKATPMASHNSFDNQSPALLDRHPHSPPPPSTSSSNFLIANSSPLVFAQPALPLNLRHSVEDGQTPSPVPAHLNSVSNVVTPTVATVLRSSQPLTNSPGFVLIDGRPQSIEAIQNLIANLKDEIALRDVQIARLTGEVEHLHRMIGDRNRDVDQLKSVLDQKYISLAVNNSINNSVNGNGAGAIMNNAEEYMEFGESGGMTPLSLGSSPQPNSVQQPPRVKKQGVCGESVSRNGNIGFIHYEKDHKLVTAHSPTLDTD